MVVHSAFKFLNPRTISSCKRFVSAGVAGNECHMVLRQAKAYEQRVGRDLFGIDAGKLNIQSILPRVVFGMDENNTIFIRNWQQLNVHERQALSPYFNQAGMAHVGKSGDFIQNILPNGRTERRSFETFNIVHGLNLEVSEEGYLKLNNEDNLDSKTKDLIEFYFTQDGYAKMYFQNGFLEKLGLRVREHIPSQVKTREELLNAIHNREKTNYTGEVCDKLVKHRNPSIKSNMKDIDPVLSNIMTDKYMVYTAMSDFLNEDLIFLGTTEYAEEFFNTGTPESMKNVLALTYYKSKDIGIAFNPRFIANLDYVTKFLDKSEREHWIPEKCNTLKYFIGHEYAHALAQVYDLRRDPIIRSIEEELLESGNVEEELSTQAKFNSMEFVADAWAEYVNSPHPRETAMLVGERILRFMQKKVVIL